MPLSSPIWTEIVCLMVLPAVDKVIIILLNMVVHSTLKEHKNAFCMLVSVLGMVGSNTRELLDYFVEVLVTYHCLLGQQFT